MTLITGLLFSALISIPIGFIIGIIVLRLLHIRRPDYPNRVERHVKYINRYQISQQDSTYLH